MIGCARLEVPPSLRRKSRINAGLSIQRASSASNWETTSPVMVLTATYPISSCARPVTGGWRPKPNGLRSSDSSSARLVPAGLRKTKRRAAGSNQKRRVACRAAATRSN
jgi:hypothetical protein